MRIEPNPSIGDRALAPPTPGVGRTASFQDVLQGSLGEVNQLQQNAESIIERVAAGEEIDSAVVANAVDKADLAFRTLIQIRNKLVDAFDELRQLNI